MHDGMRIYQEFIDSLVDISHSCVEASVINKGKTEKQVFGKKINRVLQKLSDEEKETLSQFVLQAYTNGIYHTLEEIEDMHNLRGIKIIIGDTQLPIEGFEGLSSDYSNRRAGWKWPD